MKRPFLMPVVIGVLILIFALAATAQNKSLAAAFLKTTGRTAVIVVGNTAKAAAKVVKFTAPIALKATGKTTVFGFHATKFLIGKTFPVGRKLLVTYLKAKLPL
jgi:hypothetical protein